MKLPNTSRLHSLRMENDQKGYDMAEMRPRFEAYRTRHEDGTSPQIVTAYQLFQTPVSLAARLVATLGLHQGARVLEPSAGLGRILDALPAGCEAVAVEMAASCAGALFSQDRNAKILQRDFLTLNSSETGLFDAVAMNPPFHMRSDIAHILHARTFLKPGGKLAALCMNTHHREKALRHLCQTWEVLPAGSFKESNTGISAILLTLVN